MKRFILFVAVSVFFAGIFGCGDNNPAEPETVEITVNNNTTDYTACVELDGEVLTTVASESSGTVTVDKDNCLYFVGYQQGGSCSNWDVVFDVGGSSPGTKCFSDDATVDLP